MRRTSVLTCGHKGKESQVGAYEVAQLPGFRERLNLAGTEEAGQWGISGSGEHDCLQKVVQLWL